MFMVYKKYLLSGIGLFSLVGEPHKFELIDNILLIPLN